MTSRRATVAGACGALLALGSAEAASAVVRSPCNPKGREPLVGKGERQRVLLASSQVQVFQVIDPADISGARFTYACVAGSKRAPLSIGNGRPGGPPSKGKHDFGLQVAGRFVGYNVALAGVDREAAGPAIRIVDVRRRSHRTFIGATDFALRRGGTFDAVVRVGPFSPQSDAERDGLAPGAGPFEVRRYGRVRDRTSVRLDAGEGIDPTSMVGDESRTYWLKAGVPMSAGG